MNTLTIIGLGAGDLDQLSLGVYRKLKEAKFVVARTDQHPAIAELRAEGMAIESFDEIYENDSFQQVYEEIVRTISVLCAEKAVTYVVPGHPLVAEQTVQLLIEKEREGLLGLKLQEEIASWIQSLQRSELTRLKDSNYSTAQI